MQHIKHIIFVVMLAVGFFLLPACTGNTDPAEMYKGESGEQIFARGEAALREKNYNEAVKRFEALDAQYPFGHNAELGELHIIFAYYKTGDYASAEAAADRFIHSHPTSCHVDYAYFMRGLSNYYQNMGLLEQVFVLDLATRDLTQIKKSFSDFSALVHLFPGSCYAPAAHQYLIYLRNVLANHELEVAQYYYCHGAYMASANRANEVIRYYQGSSAVPEGLCIMAKSYRHLCLPDLANDSLSVLHFNFPHCTCDLNY